MREKGLGRNRQKGDEGRERGKGEWWLHPGTLSPSIKEIHLVNNLL